MTSPAAQPQCDQPDCDKTADIELVLLDSAGVDAVTSRCFRHAVMGLVDWLLTDDDPDEEPVGWQLHKIHRLGPVSRVTLDTDRREYTVTDEAAEP